jgi:hypothetical protein
VSFEVVCVSTRQYTMGDSEIDVDNIIEQLLSVRGARPGRQVNLTEAEIRYLCIKSREVFIQQPVLLELEAPIKICGSYVIESLTVCSFDCLMASAVLRRRYSWTVL